MGVGCCALVSLFERDVYLAGTAAVVDMLVGEEETQGSGCSSSRLPASLCAHLAVAKGCCSQVFHTIHKRPLRSAGSHRPTSGMHTTLLPLPKDKKPGLGCNLKPTTDTKLFSRLQKLEAVDATTFTERLFLH